MDLGKGQKGTAFFFNKETYKFKYVGKKPKKFLVLSVNSIVYRLWLLADKSTNDGEKTFAIIIGLLAGVALLIIFLAFIRKVFEGPGN